MIGLESREAHETDKALALCPFFFVEQPLLSSGLLEPKFVFHYPSTDCPTMNFGRAVVYAKTTDFTEYAFDWCVTSHATAAQNLQRTVGDPKNRLGADDLGDRAFRGGPFATVERGSATPDGEPGDVHIHDIVGQLEADAFVFAKCFAESDTVFGVLNGGVMAALCGTKPAHAMRQSCRCKANLGVLETFPNLSEDIIARDFQVVYVDDGVTAHK
jgi:hypothetical protein